VRIIQRTDTRVVLLFDPRDSGVENVQLTIDYNPEEGTISDLAFTPPVIPYEDIFEYGKQLNDVTFIVMELQSRLQDLKPSA